MEYRNSGLSGTLISMPHIEDIGELEGKKSLFEDILVFSKLRRSGKDRATFV